MAPEYLARWWGPRGFTLSACEIDFGPGGAHRKVMRAPDGAEFQSHGLYREIFAPSRIVFSEVIGPGAGDALLTTVTSEGGDGKTRLTVRQTVPAMEAASRGQRQGSAETLEQLAEHVAGR